MATETQQMTAAQFRVALAEACGWTKITPRLAGIEPNGSPSQVPDPNDIAAALGLLEVEVNGFKIIEYETLVIYRKCNITQVRMTYLRPDSTHPMHIARRVAGTNRNDLARALCLAWYEAVTGISVEIVEEVADARD